MRAGDCLRLIVIKRGYVDTTQGLVVTESEAMDKIR